MALVYPEGVRTGILPRTELPELLVLLLGLQGSLPGGVHLTPDHEVPGHFGFGSCGNDGGLAHKLVLLDQTSVEDLMISCKGLVRSHPVIGLGCFYTLPGSNRRIVPDGGDTSPTRPGTSPRGLSPRARDSGRSACRPPTPSPAAWPHARQPGARSSGKSSSPFRASNQDIPAQRPGTECPTRAIIDCEPSDVMGVRWFAG